MSLAPGNVYVVGRFEKDVNGSVIDHVAKTMVYVPWEHRESRPLLGLMERNERPPTDMALVTDW